MNEENKTIVNVYGEGLRADIFRAALNDNTSFGVYINLDDLTNKEIAQSIKEEYIIVSDLSERNFLVECGFNPIKVVIFYDRRIKTKQASQIIKQNRKILNLNYWIEKCITYQIERRRGQSQKAVVREINEDARFIEKYHSNKRIVFFGFNEHTGRYLEKLDLKQVWGIIPYEKDKIDSAFAHLIKKINDLLFEDFSDIFFYFMNKNEKRISEGLVVEMGGIQEQLFYCGRKKNIYAGTKVLNMVDPIVGFCRKDSDTPGFVIFGSENIGKNNTYKIVTLGGSTSDPLLENVRSWSEFLYRMLTDVCNIPIVIYAGGVSSYSAAQETLKLIKDGLVLKPNLVISYSGVNDSCDDFDVKHHRFIRTYMPEIFSTVLQTSIKNPFSENAIVKDVMLGVEDKSSNAEFWFKCEKIMASVCKGFGITFHGILQAVYPKYWISNDMKDDGMIRRAQFFEEAKELIHCEQNAELYDFTEIMRGKEEVFYDYCHVYEKGNKIIAKEVLSIIIEDIRRAN